MHQGALISAAHDFFMSAGNVLAQSTSSMSCRLPVEVCAQPVEHVRAAARLRTLAANQHTKVQCVPLHVAAFPQAQYYRCILGQMKTAGACSWDVGVLCSSNVINTRDCQMQLSPYDAHCPQKPTAW